MYDMTTLGPSINFTVDGFGRYRGVGVRMDVLGC